MALLELAVGGAFVLRIKIDRRIRVGGKVVERPGESVALCRRRRFFSEERDKPLGRIVPVPPLDKTMQVADIPQGIDLDVEEELHGRKVERHRGTQIRLGWRRLAHGGAGLEQAQAVWPDTAKHRFPALDKSVQIAFGEGRDRRQGVLQNVALLAPEIGNQREIIRRGELPDAVGVPVAKLADARVGGQRRRLPGEDRAGLGERSLIVVPQPVAFERGEIIGDLIALDVPHEGAASRRQPEALENIDIVGELNGVMEFGFAVALVIAAFLAAAGLDVAGHVAARLLAQQIGHANEVIGGNTAAIYQRIASHHGVERQPFAITIARLGQIGERLVQLGDNFALEQRAPFPQ
jgi:hypothetical protein